MLEVATTKHLIEKARAAESEQLQEAAALYEQVLAKDNLAEEVYDRLMIVYRKLRDHKHELLVIDRGIRAFQNFHKTKSSTSKKVADLSNKLAQSVGLIDKKGNSTYDPEPIGKWKKRRLVVEKKLKPKKR